MKLFKTFLYLFVSIAAAEAQPVVVGLKIGAPLTDLLQNQSGPTIVGVPTGSANSYTLGPYLEVRLPLNLSLEADALYRGLKFSAVVPSAATLLTSTSGTASQWDFPVVAKYKFLKGPVRPYVEGGLDFSHISDIPNFITANHNSNFGIVLGGGVEIHALVLRISPEIRYTGDALKNFDSVVNSNRNQLAFLVGIGF